MAWMDEKISVCDGQIEKPALMILDSEAKTNPTDPSFGSPS